MELLVLCLLSLVGIVSSKNTYIATVPRQIRAGEDAEICIAALTRVSQQVNIAVTLLDKDNKTVQATRTVKLIRQRPVTVRLKVPLSVSSDNGLYSIRVKATGGLSFDEIARYISVSRKTSSIFVQTDKAAYKPGDLVQYRVLGTNSNLKVLTDPLDIIILDPKNNRVQQHLKVKPAFGVYADTFQLSTLTNLGEWTIQVDQGIEKATKTFSVERFVLPRFEVNVIMPSFQVKTEKYFKIRVTAKYTFGKPVKGTCELKIRDRWSDNNAIVKNFNIDGIANINVLMSDIIQISDGLYSVRVTAVVTEGITGISANDTQSSTLHDTGDKLSFSSNMPNTFKPGIPYDIILRATKLDDSALDPPLGKVNITVTYKLARKPIGPAGPDDIIGPPPPGPIQREIVLWSREIQIPTSGVIRASALFPTTADSADIQASYRKSNANKYLSRAHSPSNSFIQVSIANDAQPVPNKYLPLNIVTTEKKVQFVFYKMVAMFIRQMSSFRPSDVKYESFIHFIGHSRDVSHSDVISKGGLVTHGRWRLRNGKSNTRLRVTYEMTPSAKLLVYYTRRDGEIVADALTFSTNDVFRNKVDIRFNKQKALPGEDVSLDIRGQSRSLVSVLAVDKSVLLYKSGNDITVQDVMRELQQYDGFGFFPRFGGWDFWFPRPIEGVDADSVFRNFGVIVLTDATLYKHPDTQDFQEQLKTGFAEYYIPGGSMGDQSAASNLATPLQTRKNFPETWLWVNVTTRRNGRAVINSKAPDTITEWVTSAFSVNPRTGLGVASPLANLTTFQRFFMRFDLPFSAIRGEQIIVQISVFNYLDTDQNVVVILAPSNDYIFLDTSGNKITRGPSSLTKTVLVKANGVNAVYIPIQPTTIGKIKLKATARSPAAADAVEREFLIEAEGIKQSYNVPLLTDLRSQNTFKSTIDIDFPPNLVKDSEFIKLQVIGDLLGPTLNGIDDLLRMSYGCGEQNLVGFSTNVYVTTYLQATGRLTSALRQKSETILEAGYQRELSYSHNDGSYSAFGNNDKSGTTWLTAYVIKSFAQASQFTFIDINVMTKAINWTIEQQQTTGAFKEPGKVLHKAMQGGSASSDRSLACFVLIALEEARRNGQVDRKLQAKVQNAITKATNFIAKEAPSSIDNLYELAITFYALSLVNHNLKDQLLIELEKKAQTQDGGKYWKLTDTVANKVQPWKSWQPPRTNARAIDVEMTSYVLLGYNIRSDTPNGIQVLRWLSNQRNPNGGFISTQDTVIALQALSGLGVNLFVKTFSMSVDTKAASWTGRKFTVNDANALVLQTEDLPKTVRSISIDATGKGLCLLEAAVYYNVYEELREPAFDLQPTVFRETINGFSLKVCFRWLRGGESTMGLLEINIPSGMEADIDSLDTSSAQGQFTSIEKAFRQVNLFFDAILSTQMCIEINIIRTSMVAKHKPQAIRLSEYYEPSNEVIKTYISNKLANATIIEVCGPENCQEVKKR